jgi:hypothetical protein
MGWLARNPEVEATELADGAVLLNMETRLYYSLNETGLELWNAIDDADGPEQVAERLARDFDVEDAAALGAVNAFVPELASERLVVESSANAAADEPARESSDGPRRAFEQPQLIKHDEPLHEVANKEFDPQLPLAE